MERPIAIRKKLLCVFQSKWPGHHVSGLRLPSHHCVPDNQLYWSFIIYGGTSGRPACNGGLPAMDAR